MSRGKLLDLDKFRPGVPRKVLGLRLRTADQLTANRRAKGPLRFRDLARFKAAVSRGKFSLPGTWRVLRRPCPEESFPPLGRFASSVSRGKSAPFGRRAKPGVPGKVGTLFRPQGKARCPEESRHLSAALPGPRCPEESFLNLC